MNDRMKQLATCLLLATLAVTTPAFAQLRLTIHLGRHDPIPIAVVPFARACPPTAGSMSRRRAAWPVSTLIQLRIDAQPPLGKRTRRPRSRNRALLLPRRAVDLRGRARRVSMSVRAMALKRRLEVTLHDARDIEPAVGGHGARERHDRDRDRIGDARGDGEPQLREGGVVTASVARRRQVASCFMRSFIGGEC